MALERGRLPHLFDVGASRGSRFLNTVVRALCALPPVERLLASEQLRSRFVRHALVSTGDPDRREVTASIPNRMPVPEPLAALRMSAVVALRVEPERIGAKTGETPNFLRLGFSAVG
jgi:hypothetical protein